MSRWNIQAAGNWHLVRRCQRRRDFRAVTWGRYRLEVEGAGNGAPVSSVEFDAGFYVEASSTETPDALEIALDKQSYKIGDTAKLKVSSRFAGELMITSGSEK